jgi:hypothetical protein
VLVALMVLIVTNLGALAALVWYLLRPVEHPSPDETLAQSLSRHQRPATSTTGVRRVITIEILNAREVAGSRGRLASIAGSLAPGITERVVYDQAVKLVRRQLAGHRVVADVRLHVARADDTLLSAETIEPELPDDDQPT